MHTRISAARLSATVQTAKRVRRRRTGLRLFSEPVRASYRAAASARQRTPRATAVRAAKIMGLEVCGVDLLRSNHGPVVMEVNSSPGLEGIEGASEKDVAGVIIDYMEKRVAEVANRTSRSKTRGKG